MPIDQKTNQMVVTRSGGKLAGAYNTREVEGRPGFRPTSGMDNFRLAAIVEKRRARILYASEDKDKSDFLAHNLLDYEIRCTESAADAIYLAMTGGYDLILVDDHLSGITGIEICRQIRAYNHRTPILVMAGPNEDAKRRHAIEAGAQGYWPEPLEFGKLDCEIGRLLDLKQKCMSAVA
jgi:CheY-like chemotaxis protein